MGSESHQGKAGLKRTLQTHWRSGPWRPDSGWRRAASPARAVLWARRGAGPRVREPGPPPCRPVCSLHTVSCVLRWLDDPAAVITRAAFQGLPSPGKFAPLSWGVQRPVSRWAGFPPVKLRAELRAGSGAPFHLIAGLHLLFMPWTHFWWSGEQAFLQNNVFKYILKAHRITECNVKNVISF